MSGVHSDELTSEVLLESSKMARMEWSTQDWPFSITPSRSPFISSI